MADRQPPTEATTVELKRQQCINKECIDASERTASCDADGESVAGKHSAAVQRCRWLVQAQHVGAKLHDWTSVWAQDGIAAHKEAQQCYRKIVRGLSMPEENPWSLRWSRARLVAVLFEPHYSIKKALRDGKWHRIHQWLHGEPDLVEPEKPAIEAEGPKTGRTVLEKGAHVVPSIPSSFNAQELSGVLATSSSGLPKRSPPSQFSIPSLGVDKSLRQAHEWANEGGDAIWQCIGRMISLYVAGAPASGDIVAGMKAHAKTAASFDWLNRYVESNKDAAKAGAVNRVGSRSTTFMSPEFTTDLFPSGVVVSRYLDVGAGNGRFAKWMCKTLNLKQYGPGSAVAVDLYKKHREPSDGVSFRVGSAESLPFEDGEFDLVSFVNVLHHVEDPHTVLMEARRVLRPGGLLLIRDHDVKSAKAAAFITLAHELLATVARARRDRGHALKTLHNRAMVPRGFHSVQEWKLMLGQMGLEECGRIVPKHDMMSTFVLVATKYQQSGCKGESVKNHSAHDKCKQNPKPRTITLEV